MAGGRQLSSRPITEDTLCGRGTWQVSTCDRAGIVTMIIVRTLRRDIAKYNKIEDEVSILHRRLFVANSCLLRGF